MRKRVIAASAAAAVAAALAVAPLSPAAAAPTTYELQILHFYGESGLLGIDTAPALGALVDQFRTEYPNTITLAEGDTWIPGPWLVAGADPSLNAIPGIGSTALGRPDVAIMNALGVDASALGNHEYDLGSPVVQGAVGASGAWPGAQFPFITSNLNFAGDSSLRGLADATIGGTSAVSFAGKEVTDIKGKFAPYAVKTINGEKIGIVGATTYELLSKTSPNGTTVTGVASTDDAVKIPELAGIIQTTVDALTATGVNKIVMVDQLDTIDRNVALAPLLTGVDVMVAGGGHERLGDANDTAVAFNGHDAVFVDDYPVLSAGDDGNPTLIVTTDTEFTYLGRLVVPFDAAGVINTAELDSTVNGAYAATEASLQAAYGSSASAATIIAGSVTGSKVKAITTAIGAVVAAKDGNLFGYSDVYLEGDRVFGRTQEVNLGSLTADANARVAEAAFGGQHVVSLKNGGGIRASIGSIDEDGSKIANIANPLAGKPAGAISQLDIENALRFDNKLMVFDTSPQGLANILNFASGLSTGPSVQNGGYPQIGGLRFSYDSTKPVGQKLRSAALYDEDGQRIATIVQDGVVNPAAPAVIHLISLSFTANGGDSYPIKANAENFRYLKTDGTLSAAVDEALDFTSAAAATSVGITLADILGEQKAFQDYLLAEHATPATAYDVADTPASQDLRIEILAARSDVVLPVVAAPSFANGAVDCRARVTLSGISFDDLGQTGGSWTVAVAWGDGTTTTYSTSVEGAQPNLTHRYASPGTYTPVVTVTAADGTAVSKASSNAASVRQTYSIDFRGDLHDSEAGDIDVNTIRAGRTVPVKATIYDVCTQSYVNDPAADVSIVVGLDSAGPAAAAGTTQMRWIRDTRVRGGGYWQYNLRSTTGTGTPMLVGPLYRADIFVGDELGTRYEWAVLKVRR
jgi:2',3'-cyclic-nucleotide 2'-phosphodiesterase (5'-nucleotidase family)